MRTVFSRYTLFILLLITSHLFVKSSTISYVAADTLESSSEPEYGYFFLSLLSFLNVLGDSADEVTEVTDEHLTEVSECVKNYIDSIADSGDIKMKELADRLNLLLVSYDILNDETIKDKGKVKQYIVKPGETWEFIAAIHGIDSVDIKLMNPFVYDCYAGYEINVPVYLSDLQIENNRLALTDSRYIEASNLFEKKEYSKAKKIYNKIIETDINVPFAYYNRGICNFRLRNYTNAKKDLTIAINSSDNPEDVFPKASKLISQINRINEQKERERRNNYGNFLSILANSFSSTYNTPFPAAAMNNYNNWNIPDVKPQYFQYLPGISENYYNPFDTNAINREVQNSLDQLQIQSQQQKDFFMNTFHQHNPYATETDAMRAYSNFLQESISTVNESGILKSTHTTYSSGVKEVDCHICHGTGECPSCGGKGVLNSTFGNGITKCHCINGKCTTCGGSGKRVKIVSIPHEH